jgi:hypothetical protein
VLTRHLRAGPGAPWQRSREESVFFVWIEDFCGGIVGVCGRIFLSIEVEEDVATFKDKIRRSAIREVLKTSIATTISETQVDLLLE